MEKLTQDHFAKHPMSQKHNYKYETKATQYTGGGNFFAPDFIKLPYSLHLQGG